MCNTAAKTDNDSKVSIIIPIYNTGNYLRACFDSVIAQTYKNWEILAVDDGSTDESPSICDEYARKDIRIKAFHQENMRIGAARNKGLEAVGGGTLCFWTAMICCVRMLWKRPLEF